MRYTTTDDRMPSPNRFFARHVGVMIAIRLHSRLLKRSAGGRRCREDVSAESIQTGYGRVYGQETWGEV
jgi:hypothetical protein